MNSLLVQIMYCPYRDNSNRQYNGLFFSWETLSPAYMQTLAERFTSIHQRIQQTESKYERSSGSVRLLAVSKKKTISTIEAAFALGQADFAENYLQDALAKITALKHLPICWHFIGQLQSNKTQLVAEHFSWAHSVDRLKIARRLNDQRPGNLKPLNICIQVMLDEELNKGGVHPNSVLELAKSIQELPKLHLRGLMAIPKPETNFSAQRTAFCRLRQIQEALIENNGLNIDTLSMGMSNDFEAAIAEGSTIIRVGTALFGPRE